MRFRGLIILAIFAAGLFAQPIERPPRPGEPIREPQREKRPVVDRPRRRKSKEWGLKIALDGGIMLLPEGTWGAFSTGATYGRLGFGLEVAYADYTRDFTGCRESYTSPGNTELTEHGSFYRPSAYGEYSFDLRYLTITPRATLGYANIVCRRREISPQTEDTTRYERSRLTNTWELGIGVPIGSVTIGACVQWWVVNPWFYIYPEDFGLVTLGARLEYRAF